LEMCKITSIDEAAGLKDKAQQLEYYAKVRDDKKSETEFAEVKLRAAQRIGQLSRDLEKDNPTNDFPPKGNRRLNHSRKLVYPSLPPTDTKS